MPINAHFQKYYLRGYAAFIIENFLVTNTGLAFTCSLSPRQSQRLGSFKYEDAEGCQIEVAPCDRQTWWSWTAPHGYLAASLALDPLVGWTQWKIPAQCRAWLHIRFCLPGSRGSWRMAEIRAFWRRWDLCFTYTSASLWCSPSHGLGTDFPLHF